jgi:hypothetical protein
MNNDVINYMDAVESVQKRKDKSILAIRTMCPEELLKPEIAFPGQVKHLYLDLQFNITVLCKYYDYIEKYLYKKYCDCETLDSCFKCSWDKKYNDTLCKDLVNFNNLDSLNAIDVNLSNDLWIQFAQNSKCLKNIKFTSNHDCGYDEFWFDGECDDKNLQFINPKHKALDAIIQIPTLERIIFSRLDMTYFPEGLSNISFLELDKITFYKKEGKMFINNSFNLSTHTNLKHVVIRQVDLEDSPFKFSTLQLHKLDKLEELDFRGLIIDEDDFQSLRAVLQLPNLKRLNMREIIKNNLCEEYFSLIGRDFGYKMLKPPTTNFL